MYVHTLVFFYSDALLSFDLLFYSLRENFLISLSLLFATASPFQFLYLSQLLNSLTLDIIMLTVGCLDSFIPSSDHTSEQSPRLERSFLSVKSAQSYKSSRNCPYLPYCHLFPRYIMLCQFQSSSPFESFQSHSSSLFFPSHFPSLFSRPSQLPLTIPVTFPFSFPLTFPFSFPNLQSPLLQVISLLCSLTHTLFLFLRRMACGSTNQIRQVQRTTRKISYQAFLHIKHAYYSPNWYVRV